jgi:uncharacterized protein (TIRG00374 family)
VKFFISLAFGITILILIFQHLGINLNIAMDTLLNIGYLYSLIILGVYIVLVFLVALKWKAIIISLVPNIVPRRWYFMHYSSLSFLVNNFIPQSGFGVRVLSLKMLYDVPTAIGIMSQFIDQLFELVVVAIFIVPGIFYILKLTSMMESALILLALIAILFMIIKLINPSHIKRITNFTLLASTYLMRQSWADKFRKLFDGLKNKKLNTGWILSINLIKMLVVISITMFLMWSVGIDISPLEIILIAPVVYIIGLFSITPGGIGTVDVGWLGILTLLGYDKISIGKFLVVQVAVGSISLAIITIATYIIYSVSNWYTIRAK